MKRLLCCLSIGMAACVTAPPTRFDVPKDTPAQCGQVCTGMGLKMSAVVVIMSASGCVCEPAGEGPSPSVRQGAAALAGGAAIAALNAAQNQPPAPPTP
jgi:hypothetical protein